MFQFTSIWGHLINLQMPRSVLPSNGRSCCCLTRNESHKNHSAVVYCTTSLSVTIIEGSKLIWMPVHKTRKKWSRRQSICDVVIIIIMWSVMSLMTEWAKKVLDVGPTSHWQPSTKPSVYLSDITSLLTRQSGIKQHSNGWVYLSILKFTCKLRSSTQPTAVISIILTARNTLKVSEILFFWFS